MARPSKATVDITPEATTDAQDAEAGSETATVADIDPASGSDRPEAAEETPTGVVRRLFRAAGWTTRTVVTVVVIAAAVWIAAWGWPQLQEQVDTVTANRRALDALQGEIDANAVQIAELEGRISALSSETPTRLDGLVNSLEAVQADLDAASARLDDAESRVVGLENVLDDTSASQVELGAQVDTLTSDLTLQVGLLQSMEYLSRARLFLYQANYGLAEADLASAAELLRSLTAAGELGTAIDEAVFRLDRAIAALPDLPVAAAGDADIAWEALRAAIAPAGSVAPPAEPTDDTGTNP